jgi:predicted phage terminase large subunit-like protein
MAKRFVIAMKNHFESNELLQKSYGDFVGKNEWREDYFTVSKKTSKEKEPTVSCAGVEVPSVGMHFDLIIMDDLVSLDNVTTKEQMDKVIDFYKYSLNLLEPQGKLIVIGTRWNFNDLYNHILENEGHMFNVLRQGAYNDDGSLWFPQRLTKEFLDGKKTSQGSYIFACQYLNDPVDDESATFKKSWIHYFSMREKLLIPEEHDETQPVFRLDDCNLYMTVDPAISQAKHADFTGISITAVDPEQRKFVVHAKKYKIQPKEMIDEIFRLWKKYEKNLLEIGIEVSVFQVMLKDYLLNEMRGRKQYLPIVELKPVAGKKKETRIRALQPEFENGMIYIRPEMTDLEDELLRFPVGQHDDILDSLAYQTGMWFAPSITKKTEIPVGSFNWVRNKILKANKNPFYIGQENADRWRLNDGWY